MARNIRTKTGGNFININGRHIDIYLAKIVYRCEACHAPLVYHNAGLACSANKQHRGFIHRDEVGKIQQAQTQNIAGLNEFYEIKNGKVVLKNGN